ncbi:MAG TPA: protein translocase subunit SecD [Solirubrobacteraceae bacterium]|jgi:SecD/SecF fusion protein|nr:protein translocase subunit SecD [Solirubrobacteraceae bacterium]
MSDRRRNIFVLTSVLGLLIASLVVIFGVPGATSAIKTRLGLDLKGGVELVYQGKPTKQSLVTPDALNRAIDIMRQRVDALGVAEPEIQRSGTNQIVVDLPDVKNAARAEAQVGQVAQLFFYDWEPNVIGPSGSPAPTDAAVTGGASAGSQAAALSQYDAVIRASKRPAINRPSNTTNGTYYLVDDKSQTVLRGPEDSQSNLLSDQSRPAASRVVEVKPGTVVVQAEQPTTKAHGIAPRYFVLNDDPALKGTDIKDPQQNFDNGTGGSGQPIVTFNFTDYGRGVWQRVTRGIAQRGANFLVPPGNPPDSAFQHFAIVLDNKLISAPYIDFHQNPDGIDAANGSQIQGGFTIDSAQTLANLLKSGALPIKLQLISQSQVSATLGKQALNQGLIAGLVGFAVVALFLVVFYRVLGVIAVGALLVYSLYFFALIKLIPITLTLPGIAGLILTIGVAADANIVIFERVKEEIRAGRSIAAGIAAGYKRGFAAIVDANIVTFMAAFILFMLATAGVKGFALVLGIGTVVSLFTAVLATQAILGSMGRSRTISSPAALGASPRTRSWTFDFMGASKWFFSLSGTILLVGALAIGGNGLKFGIDFESGTRIKTALVKPANEGQVRDVFRQAGFADAQIQKITGGDVGGTGFQISTRTLQPGTVTTVKQALDRRFGTRNFSNQSIGPTFGQTVANSAIIAIIASLLVIAIYIALRFEWKYAVPVMIALMHDLLITAGVYSLTNREVTTSTVAALLTILGYSLYDTIIVFDRVRENVPRMPRAAFSQIVNRSMSEVLTRSLATSFCTLLPVASLLLFGGETLKDFAFALLVGVASGAYSSIFIASPVLTHWKEREPVYTSRRRRIESESGGVVPAYALLGSAAAVEVEPDPSRRRRRGRLTAPEDPEQGVSRQEFEELVRDLHVDEPPGASGPGPADDLAPEDVVMPKRAGGVDGIAGAPQPKRAKAKAKDAGRRPRNRRHGRSR